MTPALHHPVKCYDEQGRAFVGMWSTLAEVTRQKDAVWPTEPGGMTQKRWFERLPSGEWVPTEKPVRWEYGAGTDPLWITQQIERANG